MIKKLQKRFIGIAMLSIFLVLLLIIGSINVINYVDTNRSLDMRLSILLENNGLFPKDFLHNKHIINPLPNRDASSEKPNFRGMSEESAFDTRFFTVTFDNLGNITQTETEHIAAITEDLAVTYASNIFEKGNTYGYFKKYRYMSKELESGETMYIFLDAQRELDTLRFFFLASVSISLIGLLLVFLLVLFFSKIIVRPIAQSYEKQKRFITDANHEIKTPLTIIDANTEVIEMVNGENEWTISIRNQIKRLTDLTNKLVFLSRMDEENAKLSFLDFSLSDALSETAQPFCAVAESAHKSLALTIEPNISYTGDEATIRQLTELLLDNAIKYSSEEGHISLSLTTSGKNRIIKVSNTVDEIAVGKHNEYFERFYRPDASRSSATGGHGIGLSVVHAIVDAHKGKITAESFDNHSIQFTIIL